MAYVVDADLVLRTWSRHWRQTGRPPSPPWSGVEKLLRASRCPSGGAPPAAAGPPFYRELDGISRRINQEIDKVTSDRLRADLAAKTGRAQ